MRLFLIIFFIQIKLATAEAGKHLVSQMSMSQAVAHTQQAILAYPYIKAQTKHLERKLINYIPLEREYIVFTGSVGMAIIRGRLETRPIKNLDTDFMGGRIRPDVFYNFKGEDKGAYFNLTWGF